MTLFERYDWLIVFLIVFIFALTILPRGKSSGIAEIYYDGALIRTVDLKNDTTFTLEQGMEILVASGRISVIESDCPDKICIGQGEIDRPGIPIVCVPNKILIKIRSTESSDFDIVTQ
jgi:hypothetical protein